MFDPPKVKVNLIASITNFICKFHRVLPNASILRTLGNLDLLREFPNGVRTKFSFPSRKVYLTIRTKNYSKAEIKLSGLVSFCFIFFALDLIFCLALSVETSFPLWSPSNLYFLTFFFKTFTSF